MNHELISIAARFLSSSFEVHTEINGTRAQDGMSISGADISAQQTKSIQLLLQEHSSTAIQHHQTFCILVLDKTSR